MIIIAQAFLDAVQRRRTSSWEFLSSTYASTYILRKSSHGKPGKSLKDTFEKPKLVIAMTHKQLAFWLGYSLIKK